MEKDLYWVGDSLDDLKKFPKEAIQDIGYNLHLIQNGEEPTDFKPLKGKNLKGVFEIRTWVDSETYRTAYIAKLSSGIFVLHSFKKKSTKGINTPKKDIDIIELRLKEAIKQNEELLKDSENE